MVDRNRGAPMLWRLPTNSSVIAVSDEFVDGGHQKGLYSRR